MYSHIIAFYILKGFREISYFEDFSVAYCCGSTQCDQLAKTEKEGKTILGPL